MDKIEKPKFRTSRMGYVLRGWRMFRAALTRSGGVGRFAVLQDFFLRSRIGNGLTTRAMALAGFGGRLSNARKTYSIALPPGYPAARIDIELSMPPLPNGEIYEFSEHVCDAQGEATGIVLAASAHRVAISQDLGVVWQTIKVKGYGKHAIAHLKWIGDGEFLVQLVPRDPYPGQKRSVAVLVMNTQGEVLAENKLDASPWHGCRAIDVAGATLMFAEYPYEIAGAPIAARFESRVFRSRDRGRSWQVVKSQPSIRHFHFLQARPGVPREWWLTSGDGPAESRIWVSRDDGDSWSDLTDGFGDHIAIGKATYPRALFRLTDLAWQGDEIIWGTDDFLSSTRRDERGARVFRSTLPLAPAIVGRAKWPIRSMVDVGDFYLFQTQGGFHPDATIADKRPGVFLMPKQPVAGAPNLVHLFDAESHSSVGTGFTYSRASRVAKDGVFFSFRASTDVFPIGHQVLKWQVRFN